MIVHESFYDDYCYNSSLFLLVKAFFSPLASLTRFQERVAFVSVGLRLANSFILRLFPLFSRTMMFLIAAPQAAIDRLLFHAAMSREFDSFRLSFAIFS